MRIYVDAKEAFNEIKRDLAEMGIEVHPKTMQDKNVEGNPDYATKELQNYMYTILNVNPDDVPGVNQPWANEEFRERMNVFDSPVNPGVAYKLRDTVWDEFLHDGKFAYTYNERIHFNQQMQKVIDRILEDPDSRQLWVSLWRPDVDIDRLGGVSRVPCSLGYHFQVRKGKLNMTYVMRSCDYVTHMPNDVYLAMKLQQIIAQITGYEVGTFTHVIFSLHVYNKDIKGVF